MKEAIARQVERCYRHLRGVKHVFRAGVGYKKMAQAWDVSEAEAKKRLAELVEIGMVRKSGPQKKTRYFLQEEWT